MQLAGYLTDIVHDLLVDISGVMYSISICLKAVSTTDGFRHVHFIYLLTFIFLLFDKIENVLVCIHIKNKVLPYTKQNLLYVTRCIM